MEKKQLQQLLKKAYHKLESLPLGSEDISFNEYLQKNPKSEIKKFFDYFEHQPNWDDKEISEREDAMLCEIIRIDIENHIDVFRHVFKQLLLGIDYVQNKRLVESIIDFYKLN